MQLCTLVVAFEFSSIVFMAPMLETLSRDVNSSGEDARVKWNTIELLSHDFNIF